MAIDDDTSNQNSEIVSRPTDDSGLSKHITPLREKLSKFLAQDKPTDVLIIKAHLICEYYLNQILIIKESCNANELNRISFSQKNERALNRENQFERQSSDSLRILNRIRNRVGHELEYVLSEADVDALGYVQGKEYILRKYDSSDLSALLRWVLIIIATDIALVLFGLVKKQQKIP